MTEFGYTMMCEQSPPDALVSDIQRAEAPGFDFSQISDHFQPWLVEQGASQFVTESDVAESIPCGADVDEFVAKIKPFVDAGFTEVGLVQIGGAHQEKFIDWAERELLPALREL